MSGYIGNIPTPQATQSRQSFTATAGQTTFATVGYTAGFLDVYLNGVHLLDGTDYTATNGSDIVLTTGAALDDVVEFVAYETFSVFGQSFTGTVTATAFAGDGSSITGLPVTYFSQSLVTITFSQTFTLPANSRAEILAVGGGGSGGVAARDDDATYSLVASGGGAGGACYLSVESSSAQDITIVVGAGGAAVSRTADGASNGNAGGTTTVTGTGISLSAGGGGGGNGYFSATAYSDISVAGASGGTATGGSLNYTGGSTGTITRSGSNLDFVNVGPGAAIFGGDVPAITRGLGFSTGNLQVNQPDDYSSTSSVPTVTYDSYASALGAYINNNSDSTLIVVCNAGSNGGGSGGGVAAPYGDSTTGPRRVTGANGGDGFVLIKIYEELS